jgi:hypothetical protein
MNSPTIISVALVFVGIMSLIAGLYIDVRSLFLEIKRAKFGKGSSGVPLVAILFYFFGVWALPLRIIRIGVKSHFDALGTHWGWGTHWGQVAFCTI